MVQKKKKKKNRENESENALFQKKQFFFLLSYILFLRFDYATLSMVRITNNIYHEAYEYIKADAQEGNCIVFVAADVDSICAIRIFQVRFFYI